MKNTWKKLWKILPLFVFFFFVVGFIAFPVQAEEAEVDETPIVDIQEAPEETNVETPVVSDEPVDEPQAVEDSSDLQTPVQEETSVQPEIATNQKSAAKAPAADSVTLKTQEATRATNATWSSFRRITSNTTYDDYNIRITYNTTQHAVEINPGVTVTFKNCTITDEKAQMMIKNYGTLIFEDCEINMDINAKWMIETNGSDAKVILKNSTVNLRNGAQGIVSRTGSTVDIEDSSIILNGNGKGLYVLGGGTINMKGNSELTGLNSSSTASWGIIAEDGSTLNIEGNTNIHDNTMTSTQAARSLVYIDNATLNIKDNAVFQNNNGYEGGAVYVNNGTVNIGDGVTFRNNHAGTANTSTKGGALVLINSDTTIGNAMFDSNGVNENYQTRNGGAIYMSGGNLTMNGTSFYKNSTATRQPNGSGGALYAENKAIIDANGTQFIENSAGRYGGAVTLYNGSILRIGDLNGVPAAFLNNVVTHGYEFAGGAIAINGDETDPNNHCMVIMKNAAFYGNHSDGSGGAIATCHTGSLSLFVAEGAAIFDNTADGSPLVPGSDQYPDIYIYDYADTTDRDTGNEVYERMFNGGLHNWTVKYTEGADRYGVTLPSVVLKSNATNTDISNASVVFFGNQALNGWNEANRYVSGGAIGNNGRLIIGADVELKIYKYWDDSNNIDGIRPTLEAFAQAIRDGKVVITGDGQVVDLSDPSIQIDVVQMTSQNTDTDVENDSYAPSSNVVIPAEDDSAVNALDPANTYMIIISGLPKQNAEGTDIVYTVSEESLTGYISTISDRIITNVLETVDLYVTKAWDDENDNDRIRPESVTVHLFADGVEIPLENNTLSAANDWTLIVASLPIFANGKEIVYTITEDPVEGYTTTITGDALIGVTVTNTHLKELIDILVRKVWDDGNNLLGTRPSTITVRLFADGTEVSSYILSEATGWELLITDLAKYADGVEIVYTITEDPVEGYDTIITGDAVNGFEITNCSYPVVPDNPNDDDKKPVAKKSTNGVQTGMESLFGLYSVMSGLSLAGAVVLRKRNNA